MSPAPRTGPVPGPVEPGRKPRRSLVLAAWTLVGLAAIPLALGARVDSPVLAWFLALATLLPLLLLLAVLALTVRAGIQARRLPERFRAPRWGTLAWSLGAVVAGGLVTFPLLTSSRAPVRPRAAQENAVAVMSALTRAWDQANQDQVPPEALPARLEAALASERALCRNPYGSGESALPDPLLRLQGMADAEALRKAMAGLAGARGPGQVIVAYQLGGPGTRAFVAAAVRCPGPRSGDEVFVKVGGMD